MSKIAEVGAGIGVLMLSQSVPVSNEWLDLVGRFGVPIVGIAVLIWWGRQREMAMTKRIQEIEDSRVSLLTTVIQRNTDAMNAVCEVVKKCPRPDAGK